MRPVYDVATVRAAEEAVMAGLPEGALMERAATGLADACATLMRDLGLRIAGARVVLLIGSGNNGGDALYSGAQLARRGARVDAVLLGDRSHAGGLDALVEAGGVVVAHAATDQAITRADLILDGILGIGGRGALRAEVARCATLAAESGALVVAVDIPSGVDADTGAVADAAAAIDADATVTFGCLKPGLLLSPGRDHAGAVLVVDIGLDDALPPAGLYALDPLDLADAVPEPGPSDYKYSRGVVGIAAGSPRYRGAAFMATGSARHGNVGMVHVLDRGDGLAEALVDEFWDVVIAADAPASVTRTSAWVVGPGLGLDVDGRSLLRDVLNVDAPVVVDADALRMLRQPPASDSLSARKRPTVLTPHEGEFAALGFTIGTGEDQDRLESARQAARELGAVIVLKGPGTVIASPSGAAYIDTWGTPDLGAAGSGDVLAGLMAALLAGAAARGDVDIDDAARIAAAAVGVHGLAGRLAAQGGRPVTAPDIIAAIPDAIGLVRRGGEA
jgi:ADP-dependent NAD(P)H-hydrate dehydratase / NAD(P)H-hydrate epimerase